MMSLQANNGGVQGKLPQGVGGADGADISMEEEEEEDQVRLSLPCQLYHYMRQSG